VASPSTRPSKITEVRLRLECLEAAGAAERITKGDALDLDRDRLDQQLRAAACHPDHGLIAATQGLLRATPPSRLRRLPLRGHRPYPDLGPNGSTFTMRDYFGQTWQWFRVLQRRALRPAASHITCALPHVAGLEGFQIFDYVAEMTGDRTRRPFRVLCDEGANESSVLLARPRESAWHQDESHLHSNTLILEPQDQPRRSFVCAYLKDSMVQVLARFRIPWNVACLNTLFHMLEDRLQFFCLFGRDVLCRLSGAE
jgi:hypothetical protein